VRLKRRGQFQEQFHEAAARLLVAVFIVDLTTAVAAAQQS
jgi:hypothetical protein